MLDFEIIETPDSNKLILVDNSKDITGSVTVTIEIPNRGTAEEKSYTVGLVNTFYDTDLNTPEEEDLPDGVYTFTVKTSSENVKKSSLKISQLQEDIDKVYIRYLKEEEYDKISPKLTDIEMNLESAQAHLRSGDALKARYFYDRSRNKVEKLLNC